MLKSKTLQEAGLLRGQDRFNIHAGFCRSSLNLLLRLLGVVGRRVRMGGGVVQVQRRAKRERLVARVADEPMELTDAPTKVRLAPHLEVETVDQIPSPERDL